MRMGSERVGCCLLKAYLRVDGFGMEGEVLAFHAWGEVHESEGARRMEMETKHWRKTCDV